MGILYHCSGKRPGLDPHGGIIPAVPIRETAMSRDETFNPRGAPITLENLSKYYGTVGANRDVNLDISPGEFLTLLGPSGSGKTTALMMIAGFVIPTSGDIRVNGQSIVQVPVHKRNIGMVFQNYALFPHLNVARNVSFPLEMRNTPKAEIEKRVDAALDLVRLGGFRDRRPKQLSGGQQQRVALARALIFEPTVLLLDEPLGALDAKLREEMKIEIKQLHQKIGATILFVTHDQEEALTLSDRIAVFNDGEIVQLGTPDQLYHQPANRFVADFIGETNLLSGKVISVADRQCRATLSSPLKKAPLIGFHATSKPIAAKALSPSSETMRTI